MIVVAVREIETKELLGGSASTQCAGSPMVTKPATTSRFLQTAASVGDLKRNAICCRFPARVSTSSR
jgi:hypothetical protein